MTTHRLYTRAVRRESHSPRTLAVAIPVIVLLLVLLWAGAEIVLELLRQPALLAAPTDWTSGLAGISELDPVWLGVAGAVAVILALVLLGLGLGAGRTGKRHRIDEAAAVIVDDRVVAGSLALSASRAADIDRGQVRVTIGRSTADVEITPTSGVPVDAELIRSALMAELERFRFEPALRVAIRVNTKGTVSP